MCFYAKKLRHQLKRHIFLATNFIIAITSFKNSFSLYLLMQPERQIRRKSFDYIEYKSQKKPSLELGFF